MSARPTHAPAIDRGILRVLTCGSVDDGKSTLLGRLLFDSGAVLADQLAALGAGEGEPDLSRLFDGLEAEQEQGITIDVTHRAFATPRRAFRLLDAPGHEQYTRNMATAASGADLAILLVDARKGLLPQTARHATICGLFGVRHAVVAVNKMDLVGWEEGRFRQIAEAFAASPAAAAFVSVQPVPVSALRGDNVVARSGALGWWAGPTLVEILDGTEVARERAARPLRMPVQLVEVVPEGRLYLGTVAAGAVETGAEVLLLPSGRRTTVRGIDTPSGPADMAEAGDAVSLSFADEVDLARGDVVAAPAEPPHASTGFTGHVLWFDEAELIPERSYLVRVGTATVPGAVTSIRHRLDVETGTHLAARTLRQNEIGLCNLSLSAPLTFDPFRTDPALGAFILIDRTDFRTIGAGVIEHDLRRATNIHTQALTIGTAQRTALKPHRPAILWFTGLSGSGKSTLANRVEEKLWGAGCHTILLDGDNVRQGLNRDLGFTEADRVENIRRVGEVAKLMLDAGLLVLCSFISPFRADRRLARELARDGAFLEIFVDAPVELCQARDPKGLYRRALAGEIPNFTGISAPYEPPVAPELHLDTASRSVEDLASAVVDALASRSLIHV